MAGWLAQATLETTLASAKAPRGFKGSKLWLRECTFALSAHNHGAHRRRGAVDRACDQELDEEDEADVAEGEGGRCGWRRPC